MNYLRNFPDMAGKLLEEKCVLAKKKNIMDKRNFVLNLKDVSKNL
jgi:hypothetical protein